MVCYALALGTIKGFFKQAAVRAALSHLSERKGLVTGLILSGHAFGGVLYTVFFDRLIDASEVSMVEENGVLFLPSEVGEMFPVVL